MQSKRVGFLQITIIFYFVIVGIRLFYWQIINGPALKEQALSQTQTIEKIPPNRGDILFSDNSPLALNQEYYSLSIYKPNLKKSLSDVIDQISQKIPDFKEVNRQQIESFTNNSNQKWQTFKQHLDNIKAQSIQIHGITFEKHSIRNNPENNLAKNIAGYTRQDSLDNIYGISGLEGYYNKQLTGRAGFFWGNQDATGKISLAKKWLQVPPVDGQSIHTSINRGIQDIIENTLNEGIKKYSADSGSIIVMNPESGQIIAMSSITNTTIATTSAQIASTSATKNIAISDLFEPGSIFKPLVVSIALDNHSITPDYVCTRCSRPNTIGQYTISNWDNELHPNSSLKDIIKNSDNIGMSHIIESLGKEVFLKYFAKLGLTVKSGVDLQGEARPLIKTDWPEIDLATASFGQGFAINQVQMVRSFNVIANGGFLVNPKIAKNNTNKTIGQTNRIFSTKTIDQIKEILKYAVENGVTSKFKPDNLEVCAKSGTAQVAIKGSYADSSTIASYIGFSPCNNPKFTMIVTINNPKTSPWGSSTAAPIWYEIASRISYLL